MVIVRMWAGLGNQMFIYAYYRALQEKGIEAKLDLSWYETFGTMHHGYGYLIPDIFPNSRSVIANDDECARLAIYKMNVLSRLARKIGINKRSYLSQIKIYGDYGYCPELLSNDIDDKYVEGYFQSELYFLDIENIIRKEFVFNIDCQDDIANYQELIQNTNSVSLHIRRGDYRKKNNEQSLLCNSYYYDKAIEYFVSALENPTFFVFSDEIEWCKERFSQYNNYLRFIYVENTVSPQQDMYLMSLCSHNIIANSTFSWWAAWLNNKDKTVICPAHWTLQDDKFTQNKILPEEWVKI